MNWIQFGRLIRSIYTHDGKLPDLEWIESLGLLAVKLGQVHALRVDFLEREKCEHLARLYRRNKALAPEDFCKLLGAVTPPGYAGLFETIETTPLASASIGQVHRARLKTGECVAIKVIKRDVREAFRRDVASLKQLFRCAALFYPKLGKVGDPVGILEDIEEYTLSELDLRHEVAGQKKLRTICEQNLSRFDLSRLSFAQVHEPLCNENVMVTEFIHGCTLDELLENRALDYNTLLELFRLHGFYMFCVGTFHGDLHPGNVLLTNGRLCFIDTGYIGHVGPKIRRGLFKFFASLSEYDYPNCARALNSMSEVELAGQRYDTFRNKFQELYADFSGATVSQISLTRQMMQTIKLGVRSGMSFEKGIFSIIRSLMYLDGMVLRCNPDAVLLRDMRRFITEFERHVQPT